MGRIALGLIVGLPLIVYFIAGMPISLQYPELKGFNFRGGTSIIPELAALLLALSVYTASFIAEIVRSGINAVTTASKYGWCRRLATQKSIQWTNQLDCDADSGLHGLLCTMEYRRLGVR